MKKILGITTIRSDYDLLSGLYRLLDKDPEIDFRLLVAGAHLSHNYGHSIDLIRQDGFSILATIESLIDGDSASSRLKTASILLQNSIDIVAAWSPDLIMYAGDREDVLIGAMIGVYLKIPTAHFFGGDHEKDGHSDTVVRHATSKLSTVHVVSIDEHRQRLIAMGESPARIFVAGNIALDKFLEHRPMTPKELFSRLPKDKELDGYALLIYHPVDAEKGDAGAYFQNILETLLEMKISVCASFPNTDPGNHTIIEVIRRYENHHRLWFYRNLERDLFLSLYKNACFLIGNSSSGIMEAASIPLGVVNVGLRQRGRLAGNNVVFCDSDRASIRQAVEKVLSPSMREQLCSIKNLYGDGYSCNRAYEFLKNADFRLICVKSEDPLDLGNHSLINKGAS
jgi:UDP-N-acetylglucosamine 2-epimerase (non-hydrolysing)/GDP/UDP-N,N'-diacetylbacillosamine 2-epimerase (hydrolysing)